MKKIAAAFGLLIVLSACTSADLTQARIDAEKAIRAASGSIKNAGATLTDTIELGKQGIDTATKTLSGAMKTVNQIQKGATQVQEGVANLKEGTEAIQKVVASGAHL